MALLQYAGAVMLRIVFYMCSIGVSVVTHLKSAPTFCQSVTVIVVACALKGSMANFDSSADVH